jgi:hypothetical protein
MNYMNSEHLYSKDTIIKAIFLGVMEYLTKWLVIVIDFNWRTLTPHVVGYYDFN